MDPTSPQKRRHAHAHWWLLALIIVLAFCLRTWRIDDIPVNIDETKVLAYAETPELGTFLHMVHFINPESVPLYFILVHTAKHWVTDSITGLRILNVLASLTAIPILFLLTTRIFNRSAGLFAALLLALSPVHVWHMQLVRFYVIIVPLIAFSMYAIWQAMHTGRARWLIAAFIANACMVWTHAFLYIPITISVAFVIAASWGPRRIRLYKLVFWAVLHIPLFLSPIPWHAIAFHRVPSAEINTEHQLPSLQQYAFDLVADDAVTHYREIPFYYFPEIAGVQGLREAIRSAHPVMDALLFLTLGIVLVVMAVRVLQAAWRVVRGERDGPWLARLQGEGLFVAWAVLPVTAHFVLSYVWRPCLQPRFTLYATLAVYALTAGLLSKIGRPVARTVASVCVVVLFAYQLVLVIPTTAMKTDWVSAARHIRAHAPPDEPVFSRSLLQITAPIDWFQYAYGEDDRPLYTAYTLEAIAERASAALHQGPNAPEAVWVAINREFHDFEPFEERFEPALAAGGFAFDRWIFPGDRYVYLYRLTQGAAALPGPAEPSQATVDYDALAGELFTHLAEDEAAVVMEQLRDTVEIPYPWHQPLAYAALDTENYVLAEHLVTNMQERFGTTTESLISLAFAAHARGDIAGARAACEQALEKDPYLQEYQPFVPYFQALFVENDTVRARQILEALDPGHAFSWQHYLQAVGLAPLYSRPAIAPGEHAPAPERQDTPHVHSGH